MVEVIERYELKYGVINFCLDVEGFMFLYRVV